MVGRPSPNVTLTNPTPPRHNSGEQEMENPMESQTLAAGVGRSTGSRESRRLVRSGRVPAVIYGGGQEPVLLTLDAQEFERFWRTTSPGERTVTLQCDDGATVRATAVQVDRHPYRDHFRHVDFLRHPAA